jgi:hypothetical protein
MVLSGAVLGKFACDTIVTTSQNEHQWSINDLSTGALDNLTGTERRLTTMNLSAAIIGNNRSDDMVPVDYN